ncbi:MAG: RNA methyltransferase [Halobacteriota archaeon]|nr:RNA methyltransferase [Halobacteriota archaeon]
MVFLRVVLVEPMYGGNIGSVARAMMNFGFNDLVLVSPCEIEGEAYAMASHAIDLLKKSRIADSLEDAICDSGITVGTTSKHGTTTDEHVRMPFFSPKELKKKLDGKEGIVSIIFGKEDVGLSNDLLKNLDMVVFIPTSKEYPVMNLSHAASIILYELSDIKAGKIPMARSEDKERLYDHFERLLIEINYPEHKKSKTLLMVRRILGRSEMTGREVQTLRGILSRMEWRIDRSR